jgi:predicted outer membrane protein
MSVGMVAAGLSCLVIGSAWAEQETEREYEREGISAEAEDRATDQAGQVQIDQTRQQGQQYTAQFRGTQRTAGQDEEVQRFLATCLLEKNKAEVELGKFAQQQAQNPQVKEFAQRMAQEHQQLVQKLQPLAGMQGARTSAAGQIDARRQPADTTRLPGSPGAGQLNPEANQNLTAGRAAGQQNPALNEIAQIERQITERHKEAVREELEQKQGAEFDKCYLGAQIGGHMHMLAALEVIEQQGPDQLRQIAQQARPGVEQHLEQAKQLMKQLEGGSPASSQAERQPSRTQR